MSPVSDNPYVGLRPFEMDESILFFGRGDQGMELLQRLHKFHFVAVVGSSGCGKSSLLRAGLIPALKAGHLVEDSDQWIIAIMKPGRSPLYNLAETILRETGNPGDDKSILLLVQHLQEEGAEAIIKIITPIIKESTRNFFLLVDQFEELFRFAMDQKEVAKKDEAIDFVNVLLELAEQRDQPFYIVMTMRSDFIGDCDRFYGLPEAMNKSQYLVPRLNRVQLKNVIEGPAKLFGGKLHPSLTSKMLNELGSVKDELPLLQHALMRMWDYEKRVDKNGELDLTDYEKIGGVQQALSRHAEEALAEMNSDDQAITEKMFRALTAVDENGRKIRRPASMGQLKALTDADEAKLIHIIQMFIGGGRCFLIINKASNPDDTIIDISHESLIRQWDTLRKWVDAEAESAAVYLQLAEAYKLAKEKKRDYLDGTELQIALDWHQRVKPKAVWANRYVAGFDDVIGYLHESERVHNERVAAEEARKNEEAARERREEEARRIGKRRRVRRMLITAAIIAGVLILGLVSLSVYFQRQQIKALNAEAKAKQAEQRTQELLQLVVQGRGKGYTNRKYDDVVKQLQKEQTYPLIELIEPRAIMVPITGSRNFDFLIWIDVPSFRRDEIEEVVYTVPCPGFADNVHIGKEASLGFAYGYRGYGYCPTIHISVKLKNGEPIDMDFALKDFLRGHSSP